MEFDFEKDQESLEAEKAVKKIWGGEIWITNNDLYCQKFLYIKEGWRFSLQYHKQKHETFHLLDGLIYLELPENPQFPELSSYLNNNERILKPGSTQVIRPYQIHGSSALKPSIILETSTHHEDNDTYRIRDGGQFNLTELIKNLTEKGLIV